MCFIIISKECLKATRKMERTNLLIPAMHTSPIPKPQSRFEFTFSLFDWTFFKVLQQKTNLPPEPVQRFPPRGALMLVSIAGEDLVEEGVNVVQHRDVMR